MGRLCVRFHGGCLKPQLTNIMATWSLYLASPACLLIQLSFFQACDRLLTHRVHTKMKGNKVNDVLNRLHLAVPSKRDNKVGLGGYCNVLFCFRSADMENNFEWKREVDWLGWKFITLGNKEWLIMVTKRSLELKEL